MKKKIIPESSQKSCMSTHVVMHSTFGLGVGIILANLSTGTISSTNVFIIGILFCVLGLFSHVFIK